MMYETSSYAVEILHHLLCLIQEPPSLPLPFLLALLVRPQDIYEWDVKSLATVRRRLTMILDYVTGSE